MHEEDFVTEIQRFFANSVSLIDFTAESVILEGMAYVWQRNYGWSEDFTATVIALLLSNHAGTVERPPDEDLYENPF
jgi:predicted nucleic-acid-binding protein